MIELTTDSESEEKGENSVVHLRREAAAVMPIHHEATFGVWRLRFKKTSQCEKK